MKKAISSMVIAMLGGLVVFAGIKLTEKEKDSVTVVERIEAPVPVRYAPAGMSGEMLDFTVAAEKTVNAVVHVKTESTVATGYNPWFDFFGYEDAPQVQRGSGSGVIISKDGFIVTNNHVIEGADRIKVSLNSNKSYEATVVGTDPATDIALLKIEEKDLPTIKFGNSDALRIGEWVLAVGNPFDLTSTVTAGIVSAKARNINLLRANMNREIFPIESFIQTDAAVNPGNSGGALVNVNGELVGINTAIASRTGSYSGYSFAVPTSIVQKVAADLREFGIVQRAFIGVRITEVNEEVAEDAGLQNVEGVLVSDLMESGAAAEAGIQSGDVILEVENVPVRSVPELQEQISRYRPGDEVNISVWRNKRLERVPVTLRNREGSTELREASEVEVYSVLGASLGEVDSELKSRLELDGGVQISDLRAGKLAESGVKRGFIITKVDGHGVKTPDDLVKRLEGKDGGVLIEGVYPNGQRAYYGFGM
jgi:Do/DeqQ family serine protease